ncbi:hypothetical protein ABIE44_003277 [Marmoricola sp. OAE513]|uniref:Gmad2 immunoglobulin-like domain-containing protein n=1 Tax=Marmoricola sp. OAE513 TaxID=2817894 RepID=UPI001AE7BD18
MNDDDLRNLFHEATADIRPEGTLDDIRTRTEKVDPMARRWFLPSLAAAAAMALVIGGAFWATRDDDKASQAGPAGNPSSSATADPTGVPADGFSVPAFFVGDGADGPRLFSEEHPVGDEDPQEDAANTSAHGTPFDPDYKTYWPKSSVVESVAMVSDGTESFQVFLSQAVPDVPEGVTAEQATRQVQAVVRTIQENHKSFYDKGASLPPVEFFVGDKLQKTVLGVTGPEFGPGTDEDVLALVSITSPSNNQKFLPQQKITVTGMAAAFEANVQWELLVGGDAVVDSGVATAGEGGVLSPFSFDLRLEAGTYTLRVSDTDESGEGRPLNSDTKDIVVEAP